MIKEIMSVFGKELYEIKRRYSDKPFYGKITVSIQSDKPVYISVESTQKAYDLLKDDTTATDKRT